VAWEEDFEEFLQDYKESKNPEALLSSVDNLIGRYKIELRPRSGIKQLERGSLEVVGYIFLSKAAGEFPLLTAPSGTADEADLGGQTEFDESGKLSGNASLRKWAKTA
jgi:hypothetical protein